MPLSSVTPSASRGQSACPQARLLGLVECGAHVVVATEVDPYIRSEQVVAAQILPVALKPDMLVLADRNFFSFKLWQSCLRHWRQTKQSP